MIGKIKRLLNNYYWYRVLAMNIHKRNVLKNPTKEARRVYRLAFNKNINLEDPKDLIEKIFWLQFNSDTSLWTECADKYLVRNYITEKGFEAYLPSLYGKWDKPEDIDFDKLPNNYVLKANNGCGTVMIVKDKENINPIKTRKILKQWLKIPFGYSGAQLHYLRIKPCIIAEEFLEQTDDFSSSLVDYKIWCFNGKAESVLVTFNRTGSNLDLALYDTEWNCLNEYIVEESQYSKSSIEIPRPKSLRKMIEIAEKLSIGISQVRVDFFEVNDNPYIGEMTFTTGFGYFTQEYYTYLGEKTDLSIAQTIAK